MCLIVKYEVRIGGVTEEDIIHVVTGALVPCVKVNVYAGESIAIYSVSVRTGCKKCTVDVVVSSYYVVLAIHNEDHLNGEPLSEGRTFNEFNGQYNAGTRVVIPYVSLVAGNLALSEDRLNLEYVSSDTVLRIPTVRVVKKNGEYVLRCSKVKLNVEGHSADTLIASVEVLEAGLDLR